MSLGGIEIEEIDEFGFNRLFTGNGRKEKGGDKWSANMKEKPKGEVTEKETKEYAKNNLFK